MSCTGSITVPLIMSAPGPATLKKKKTYRKHSETNPAPLKSEPIVETVEISREKLLLFEDFGRRLQTQQVWVKYQASR